MKKPPSRLGSRAANTPSIFRTATIFKGSSHRRRPIPALDWALVRSSTTVSAPVFSLSSSKLFPSFVKEEAQDEESLELYYFTDKADAYSFAECQVAAYVKKRKPYWIAYVDTYPI